MYVWRVPGHGGEGFFPSRGPVVFLPTQRSLGYRVRVLGVRDYEGVPQVGGV